MKRILLLLLVLISYVNNAQEAPSLSYYLPQKISYDQNIPTPASIIGHEVGEWHVTHDKLVQYMHELADASDRITLENRGVTFEGRPLLLLTITAPSNHKNIDRIREAHLNLTEGPAQNTDTSTMPAILYQGFSIHGNEPSGSNASMLVAYYLAAAQGPEVENLLENVVVLFDPSYNPDGLQRFAYWANTNKGKNLNPDSNDREYHEVWPGGRTNHYWFDMNRDWLPVQLPESRARIKSFHKWLPNVLTDHHEMGTNSTFFFQPGEPMRVHPLTPPKNQELTAKIATYHVKALDNIGSLYYSGENFDDYYYGKGSTFPDINGGIGILFEQGSSRGHIQESENGILTFPFTIRNQFTAALSTLEAVKSMRKELLDYQQSFFTRQKKNTKTNAYVFGDEKDAAKTYHLAEILRRHRIKIHPVKNDFKLNGKNYKKGYSYIVPANQKNSTIIEAMFEKRTTFKDSIFYDISAWTFPLAFNLDYASLTKLDRAAPQPEEPSLKNGMVTAKSNYAYLFEWHEYYTPKALYALLKKGIRVKVGPTPFTLNSKSYDYGTIMIPVQNQKLSPDELYAYLQEIAGENYLVIDGVSTGFTPEGIDLGSNDFDTVKLPKVALLTGDGITSYDAGEIWHLFDQRYDIPLTKLDLSFFARADLKSYTHIVLPNATSTALSGSDKEKLKKWIKNGGSLIAFRNSLTWLNNDDFFNASFKKNELKAKDIRFEQRRDFRGAQVTGGAIFEAKLDRSHPIAFGYKNDKIALFRNTNVYLEPNEQSYLNPLKHTDDPLLSGYISEENLELLKNSVPFQHYTLGEGSISAFTDNTNFRAFWYGTNKLLMNAIFFSDLM
ncbi:M14 family metallopeptidase [Flavobacteriaceae bacterium M23B6Z8]